MIRFVLLSTHYRQPLDWTNRKVSEAQNILTKWLSLFDKKDVQINGNPTKKILEALCDDLNSIFKFIEKLEELDTEKIEPLTSIAETNLKLRKDEIKSKNIREDILKNSPEDNKDFFVVPKVVE